MSEPLRAFTIDESCYFTIPDENVVVQKQRCSHFYFAKSSNVEWSIVGEFSLICDRTSYIYILQSVFMVGVFLNGLFFGKLSDRYSLGTKK